VTTPATISLLAAAAAIAGGLLALRAARLQSWRELRWFAAVAFSSAAYALSNLGATIDWPKWLLLATSHFQLSVAVLQNWAWMRYARSFSRSLPHPAERWLERLAFALAALSLVPGVAFTGEITHHVFSPWHVRYNDAQVTPAGFVIMALCVPVGLLAFRYFVRAHRRRLPYAAVHGAAYASVVVLMLNDAVVPTGRVPLPYLLDMGFLLPGALLVWTTTLRFIRTAEDLEALRAKLESLVDERTRALVGAQEALVRAERLASLGQLANGVAHQVSNPASVVTANLRFLADSTTEPEPREVVHDALAAMDRINGLVRRLADAGRFAAASQPPTAVDLAAVVGRAVSETRSRLPGNVELSCEVCAGLEVRTRPEVLEQVLQSLLSNALEALPPERPGHIELRAERRAGGIQLTVKDDGIGMRPEVLEHAFEPFFTTKPAGTGSGLSLPVSRGIVEVHGGALWLESTPGQGTTAVLVLPEMALS